MQIVLPSEIRVWLKFAIGGSVRDFAAKVDMSPQYIYAVLRGEKEPSPLLLERVGLEVVYRVRVVSRKEQKPLPLQNTESTEVRRKLPRQGVEESSPPKRRS